MNTINNLNYETPEELDGSFDLADNSLTLPQASGVSVYFRDLDSHLIERIRKSEAVFGCVAWLTHFNILDELAGANKHVSIVVQKEDFLRPDVGASDNWKSALKARYGKLQCGFERFGFEKLKDLSICAESCIHPVRCAGNHNRDRQPACPRMHNKFLVFCDIGTVQLIDEDCGTVYDERYTAIPKAVWTGSFNMTKNAGSSLENAVLIEDQAIAAAYLQEWQQIYAISEPLDWHSDWCSPEYRVGT